MQRAATSSSEGSFVDFAVRSCDANSFGPALGPTCSECFDAGRPPVVCRPHSTVQGLRIEGLLSEAEDVTRSLFVVEAIAVYDDCGPEIQTCLQPTRVGAKRWATLRP